MAKKKSLRQQVLHSLDRIEKEYEKAKRRRSSLESKILKKLKPKPPRPSHGAKKK